MPRQAKGARLQLFGPDRKHGAWPKKNLATYRWYIVDAVDGKRDERSTGCRLSERPAAQEALVEYEKSKRLKAEQVAYGDRLSIHDALAVYHQRHLLKQNKPSRQSFLDRVPNIREGLGHILLGDLTPDDIESYKDWRRETGVLGYRGKDRPRARVRDLSDSTLRRELTDLRSALAFCYKIGITPHPCPHFELPEEATGATRWLTHSEAAALMRAARQNPKARWHLPLFINISLWTAQRKSAVLGLRWEPNTEGGHVDLERGMMHFPPEGSAQTKKRKTRCVIPNRSLLLLRAARKRSEKYVIERPGRPHERLADIKKAFAAACRNAGLETEGLAKVTPHTLGHTAITWMLERGLTAHQISRFTGKSVEIIQRRYGHHSDDLLSEVARGR